MRAAAVGLMGLLLAGEAFAADPAPFASRWDGAYVGAFVGGAAHEVTIVGTGPLADAAYSSPKGGVLAGYRLQWDRFLFGFEGDIGSPAESDRTLCLVFDPVGCVGAGLAAHMVFDAHLRATAGFVVDDRLAVFAAGGLAVARNGGGTYAAVSTAGRMVVDDDFDDETMFGYSLGAGVEYRPSEGWLLRGEVLYDVYDKTIDVTSVSQVSIPCGSGSCLAVAQAAAPYDFGQVFTARLAVIRKFGRP